MVKPTNELVQWCTQFQSGMLTPADRALGMQGRLRPLYVIHSVLPQKYCEGDDVASRVRSKTAGSYLKDFCGLSPDFREGVAEAVHQGAEEEGQVGQHVQIWHAGQHLHPGQQECPLPGRGHLQCRLELPDKLVHVEVLVRRYNVLWAGKETLPSILYQSSMYNRV